jgi:hypothetical protein
MRGRRKKSPATMLFQRRMISTSAGSALPTSVLALGGALCIGGVWVALRVIVGGGIASSAFFAAATRLDLSHKGLQQLPLDLFDQTELSHLDISHNQLTSLPPEIGRLVQLTNLNCAGNQLASLPSEIGALTALQLLGLKVLHYTTLATRTPPDLRIKRSQTHLASQCRMLLPSFRALEPLQPPFG